jgi:hypothetical protein
MCYSDTPLHPAMEYRCPPSEANLFDCNDDDYFNTDPAAGSYLATHWNVANSAFLIVRAASDNRPPEVAPLLVETDGLLRAPATITMTAAVSDTDGFVTAVEFYNGATLLQAMYEGPYRFRWQVAAGGAYTLTAKVYDDLGISTTSAPRLIVVQQDPTLPNDDPNPEEQRAADRVYLPLVVRR